MVQSLFLERGEKKTLQSTSEVTSQVKKVIKRANCHQGIK